MRSLAHLPARSTLRGVRKRLVGVTLTQSTEADCLFNCYRSLRPKVCIQTELIQQLQSLGLERTACHKLRCIQDLAHPGTDRYRLGWVSTGQEQREADHPGRAPPRPALQVRRMYACMLLAPCAYVDLSSPRWRAGSRLMSMLTGTVQVTNSFCLGIVFV